MIGSPTRAAAMRLTRLMLMGVSLLAVAALFGVALLTAKQANKLAAAFSRDSVAAELAAVSAGLSSIVQHNARWDAAVEWIAARDEKTATKTIGSGVGARGPFDFLYIITSIGSPIFTYESGFEGPYVADYNYSYELVNVIRSELRTMPLEPYATVSGFVANRGRIALVSAGRIQPIDTTNVNVETAPILIGARWFTNDDVAEIGRRLQVESLRLDFWDDVPREGALSLPLLDISGREIVSVTWFPPHPGDDLLRIILPFAGVLSFLLLLATFIAVRFSARQTDALVNEMQAARSDSMTGLLNRNGLAEIIATPHVSQAIRSGHVGLVFIDVNDFKPLNDRFGHHVGDAALQMVSDILRKTCRSGDYVARFGGDEFCCLIIDDTPELAARALAQRITAELGGRTMGESAGNAILTVALGLAIASPSNSWDNLLARADRAMYAAKARKTEGDVTKSKWALCAGKGIIETGE